GWGGDEAISHNGRTQLAHLARTWHLLRCWSECGMQASVVGQDPSFVRRATVRNALPPPILEPLRRRRGPRDRQEERLAGEIDLWRAVSPAVGEALAQQRDNFKSWLSPHDAQLELLASGHVTMRFESWAKRASRWSATYRYPLLDPRITDLALRSPADCFRSRGWGRRMFRISVAGTLPEQVTWNRRKGEPALVNAMRSTDSESAREDSLDLKPPLRNLEQVFATSDRARAARHAAKSATIRDL
ncbi:MAG: asparagine synthase-related protein, partial [Actinomycetes bacterium]